MNLITKKKDFNMNDIKIVVQPGIHRQCQLASVAKDIMRHFTTSPPKEYKPIREIFRNHGLHPQFLSQEEMDFLFSKLKQAKYPYRKKVRTLCSKRFGRIVSKKTKVQLFNQLKNIVSKQSNLTEEEKEEFFSFINTEIQHIKHKRVLLKKDREKKKVEGEEFSDIVYDMLTSEPMTADDILEELNDESFSRQKIYARLSKYVQRGLVIKHILKINGNKRIAYTRKDFDELPELEL